MKTLHPKILELQKRFKGTLPQFTSVDQHSLQVRAQFDTPLAENETDHYAALFNVPDSYGTVAIRGCFTKSINERGPQSKANEKIIHLWMHDRHEPLGQVVLMEEDMVGLKIRVRWDIDAGGMPLRIFTQTKSGTVRQNSYGFDYVWDKMEYDEDKGLVMMYEAALFETSSISILASQPEASTFRTREQIETDIEQLSELSEEFVSRLPFKYRMEFRQLVTRYKSLTQVEPSKTLNEMLADQPKDVGGYRIDFSQFKN